MQGDFPEGGGGVGGKGEGTLAWPVAKGDGMGWNRGKRRRGRTTMVKEREGWEDIWGR